MHAVRIEGLRKTFGETIALDKLDLSIERGEMFGIVGPDGAGKTTLIRSLCGIIPPDNGIIHILDLDLKTQRSAIKQKIGYLSQRFSLYPDLSIEENIEFFAEIHEVKDYDKRRNELLEFTRLTPFRDRIADKLSGGMKQKLALACTLIHRPEIIFLDEPTTGVDPVSRRDFWKILSSLLKEGITIVMTTPYLDEAERCTTVALMDHGRILLADTPSELKKQMHGEVFEVVTPAIRQTADVLRSEAWAEVQTFGDRLNVVVMAKDAFAKLREFFDRNSVEVTSLRRTSPSLENVFISLLRREKEVQNGSE
jgi:ABC-2 type transport system ATP-binding protein